jgi:hypothetical protein
MRRPDVPDDPLPFVDVLRDLHRLAPDVVRTRLMNTTPGP